MFDRKKEGCRAPDSVEAVEADLAADMAQVDELLARFDADGGQSPDLNAGRDDQLIAASLSSASIDADDPPDEVPAVDVANPATQPPQPFEPPSTGAIEVLFKDAAALNAARAEIAKLSGLTAKPDLRRHLAAMLVTVEGIAAEAVEHLRRVPTKWSLNRRPEQEHGVYAHLVLRSADVAAKLAVALAALADSEKP